MLYLKIHKEEAWTVLFYFKDSMGGISAYYKVLS